jgi:solute carrier family 32 (vesicular inhibitory amino acid transporter)
VFSEFLKLTVNGYYYAFVILLYIYLQASCVEYITLLGDSMSSVFPLAHFDLNAHTLFAITTALAILPTVCLRNLSLLSYLSGMLKCSRILTTLLLFFPDLSEECRTILVS